MRKDQSNLRLNFLVFFFILLGAVIVGRLFFLQIKEHSKYKAFAESQHIKEKKIYAKRGKVFFSDGVTLLAENQGVANVAVAPREVEDPEKVAEKLSSSLGLPKSAVLKKVKDKNDSWVIIENNVPLSKTEKLENIPGIHLEPYFNRFYPQGKIASNLIGFYGFDKSGKKRVGQYGIEGYYEKYLAGKDGFRKGVVDANQDPIFSVQNKIQEAVNGKDLVLTIDADIQYFVEGKLKETYDKYKFSSGTFIVVSPQTGEVLAMASLPNFDPNNYQKEKNSAVFKNPTVSIPYEPGSIFKPFTMAAALQEKVITPKTKYVDKGKITIGSHTIKNADLKAHGTKTMTEALELSLNTGAVFAQQKVGSERFKKYVQKFRFGKNTGIDLEGEEPGSIENILNPPSAEKKIEYANASFGQGITTTPVQVIQAFCAIANQGKLVKPHIVKKIINSDGEAEEIKPKIVGEAISAETAGRISAMMVSVVKNGYGKKSKVKGYLIGGKTGTAQTPWTYWGIQKKGYSGKVIHSFVAFAPAFDAKFLIFLKIDDPKGIKFAADSLTPVSHDIAQYLFGYMGIPSEK